MRTREEKIKQLLDLMSGRITKEDLAADRVYINEKVSKGGVIISERTTFEGKEVLTVPKGATIFEEVKTYE